MRRRRTSCLATLGTVAVAMSLSAHAQTKTTLTALRDQARPLLIFAGANDPRAEQQLAELTPHAAELRDRDMRVIVMNILPQPASGASGLPTASFAPEEEAYARQRFHVDGNDFAVVLVGKDGGEKLHSKNPIAWQKLASTIDGMPMRKAEVKQR